MRAVDRRARAEQAGGTFFAILGMRGIEVPRSLGVERRGVEGLSMQVRLAQRLAGDVNLQRGRGECDEQSPRCKA